MWLDSRGVTHTAALPDPSTAMSSETVESLRHLTRAERLNVLDALDEYYWHEYIDGTRNVLIAGQLGPEGMGLPRGYITGRITTADDAVELVRSAEPAWHTDVFEALQDFLEDLEGDPAPVLARLSQPLREAAILQPNGEVRWPVAQAESAINELAAVGCVITGLDIWPDVDGAPTEVPLSDYDLGESETDIDPARLHALSALERVSELGFRAPSVLVTWHLAR